MNSAEQQLVKSAQKGDLQAFERLIAGKSERMLSLAAGLAQYPDDAEDIYQEAMINAFVSLPKFRLQSQFSTWLYRIFVNTALSSRRKFKNALLT